jgi:hypothetical protein
MTSGDKERKQWLAFNAYSGKIVFENMLLGRKPCHDHGAENFLKE